MPVFLRCSAFSFQACRSAVDDRVFTIDRCQLTGQVIDIQRAWIQLSQKWNATDNPPQCLAKIICTKRTYHDEIMNCNGKGNCSFSQDVFNVPRFNVPRFPQPLCQTTTKGNSVSVTYICICLLYTSPSPRDGLLSRMPSSA